MKDKEKMCIPFNNKHQLVEDAFGAIICPKCRMLWLKEYAPEFCPECHTQISVAPDDINNKVVRLLSMAGMAHKISHCPHCNLDFPSDLDTQKCPRCKQQINNPIF